MKLWEKVNNITGNASKARFLVEHLNAGAKFITASLWPIKSQLAKENSIQFLKTLKNNGLLNAISKLQNKPFEEDNAPFIYIFP